MTDPAQVVQRVPQRGRIWLAGSATGRLQLGQSVARDCAQHQLPGQAGGHPGSARRSVTAARGRRRAGRNRTIAASAPHSVVPGRGQAGAPSQQPSRGDGRVQGERVEAVDLDVSQVGACPDGRAVCGSGWPQYASAASRRPVTVTRNRPSRNSPS